MATYRIKRSGRSSQTELLSRVAVAEAELEELVLSTLAAFFAIASVEWLRG